MDVLEVERYASQANHNSNTLNIGHIFLFSASHAIAADLSACAVLNVTWFMVPFRLLILQKTMLC